MLRGLMGMWGSDAVTEFLMRENMKPNMSQVQPPWCVKLKQLNLSLLLLLGIWAVCYNNIAWAQSKPDGTHESERDELTLLPTDIFLLNQSPSTLILSQQPPNPITPTSPAEEIPRPEAQPETPLDRTPNQQDFNNLPDIPGTITVERFEFKGNTAVSNEELEIITERFTNREITFAELLQVEDEITNLYIKKGYINSGAVIPAEQTFSVSGAVVTIEVIEGEVEDIKVTGTRRLNPNYVRSRLSIATKKPLNQKDLLEALQLLQLNPLIENISAQLSAGARQELSLLTVNVTEADSFSVTAFANNGRAPTVGTFRRGVELNERNLLGFGDSFNAVYTNTDGSDALDLSYTIPFNARNGTIRLAGGFTDTDVIEPPFDRLDITGDSRYYELNLRQPVFQSPVQEFALGLTASRQESETELDGDGFPLSAGANEDGETRISAIRFFQDWTKRNPSAVFAIRSQFSLGIDVLDATVNSDPPDSRFFSWRGQGQYVRLLAPETLLVLRSDLQLAPRALVPLEQFGLGGLQSVRGYRQDVLLTDNGFFTSAEVRFPIVRVENVEGVLQVVPFVDFGVGWNSSGNDDPDPNTLVGIGLGLQWEMGNNFNARFDYGIPLTDVDSTDRTLQEQGLYFSVNYTPF